MIKLTRLGGDPFILNADLIRYVEACPDTYITLTSGDRVVVTETMDEVVRRAVTYQQMKQLIPNAFSDSSPERALDATGRHARGAGATA